MAAVICKTIGDLCSSVSNLCCRPACQACSSCASFGCREIFASPFFPYLALTFALNLPGVVYGVKSIGSNCDSLTEWLVANAILCLIHMAAAWYIVNRIREPEEVSASEETNVEEGKTTNYVMIPKENETGPENSFQRIKYVLCYDKIMAMYIIIFVVWLVWMSLAVGRRFNADNDGCDDTLHYMNVAMACGYSYFSLVGVSFLCSLCCLRR